MREGGKSGTHTRSGAHAVTGRQVGSVRAAWGGKARYVGGEPSGGVGVAWTRRCGSGVR
jgi:hypothetical protein